jgi:hypothetical protein
VRFVVADKYASSNKVLLTRYGIFSWRARAVGNQAAVANASLWRSAKCGTHIARVLLRKPKTKLLEVQMIRKLAALVVIAVIIALAMAPESLACHRRSYARRAVAGAAYYAEPYRGHSTRNMVLSIAAPAAIGAGIGALAGGKKAAAAGALIGGGAGAGLYLLTRRR